MTRPLQFSDQALTSIADIAEYIFERGGSSAAEKVASSIENKCRSLSRLPGILGQARPELGPHLRSFAVANHVIFFRYVDDVFEVVDVVDGRRDLDAYFADE